MEFDAFSSRLGLGQGRIRPEHSTPVAGDHVFVLGDDEPGRYHQLAVGDRVEMSQTIDLTDADLVKPRLHIRMPESMPTGLTWRMSIIINGVAFASAGCPPGRDRVLTDLTANVSKMAGLCRVGVRLELVEA